MTNVLKMYKVGVFMAARGQIAKNYIGNKIIEIFKRDFIKVEDKKIYLLADDGDNGRVQIAISMTCPKDQDNIVINTEEDGFTQEERDEVNALLTRLGL